MFDQTKDKNLPDEIEHIYPDYSLYPHLTKDTAYGFLTRGCPRQCGFCHTSVKDGTVSKKVADLDEFWNGQKNIVLLDQNILACKDKIDLLEQLAKSKANVTFNGGLDVRLVTGEVLELLKQIKVKTIHFAWDDYKQKDIIIDRLMFVHENSKWNRQKVSVYVLTNFDTTWEQDIERVEFIGRVVDFQPYVMIYNKPKANIKYKYLQRYAQPRIFWKLNSFDDYKNAKGKL